MPFGGCDSSDSSWAPARTPGSRHTSTDTHAVKLLTVMRRRVANSGPTHHARNSVRIWIGGRDRVVRLFEFEQCVAVLDHVRRPPMKVLTGQLRVDGMSLPDPFECLGQRLR